MEQNTRQMVTAGILAEEFPVQSMGDPSGRMPVGIFGRRNCPCQRGPRKALLDVEILRYVISVIVIYKRMIQNRRVNGKCADCENERENRSLLPASALPNRTLRGHLRWFVPLPARLRKSFN